MPYQVTEKTGRNDPCPCGSGKKYKRCCLQQKDATYALWAQQREASDLLTGDMMRFAARKFGEQVDDAWQDYNLTDLPVPFDAASEECPMFMPYFLFHWDPQRPRRKKGSSQTGGVVTRWYTLEKARDLSALDRLILEQATTQPISFYEVLSVEVGKRIALRDVLLGTEVEVIERTASRTLRQGDIVYAQVWTIQGGSTLGCLAPFAMPPRKKADVIALGKKLRNRIAKQNRDLAAEDLFRYAEEIRFTYLTIQDALHQPPRLVNTDGDPLVLHTLNFRIESAQTAFDALAPLAVGLSKKELLAGAEFDAKGKLRSVAFDWLKIGNAKMSTWENTVLGSIKISQRSLVAEVNSEKRAKRLRAEVEKRLGASVTHRSTTAQTTAEMLAKSSKKRGRPKIDEEAVDDILRDPAVRREMEEKLQKQVEAWAHQNIPILGGRTPLQAVTDPDGREVVESLVLEWERRTSESAGFHDIHPDFAALRRILNLPPATS